MQMAQAGPSLQHVSMHLEGHPLLAWRVSRPESDEVLLSEVLEPAVAWAVIEAEKLQPHQVQFSRTEGDRAIPLR